MADPAYNAPAPVNLDDLVPANPPHPEATRFFGGADERVANATDDYHPKTLEEKAAMTVPPGEFAEPITVAANEAYP